MGRVLDIRRLEQSLACDTLVHTWSIKTIIAHAGRPSTTVQKAIAALGEDDAHPVGLAHFDPTSPLARCFPLSDGLMVPIGLYYSSPQFSNVGRYNRQTREQVADTPGVASVECNPERSSILSTHQFLRQHRYTHQFVGQSFSRAAYTDIVATMVGDICSSEAAIDIFVSRIRSNATHHLDNKVLFNFFRFIAPTTRSPYGITDWFYFVRRGQCSFEGRRAEPYDEMRLRVFAKEEFSQIPTEDGGQVDYDTVINDYYQIYEGVYIKDSPITIESQLGGLERVALIDTYPEIRTQSIAREQHYHQQLYALRASRNVRNNLIFHHIAAFAVGYIQGVLLEMADEGVCGFLSAQDLSNLEFEQFNSCRRYLHGVREGLQKDRPEFFIAGNILGMLHVNFDSFVEAGNTRQERAARGALAECLAAVASEYGKSLPGELPDQQVLSEACAFGAALGGARAAVLGK